MNFVRPSVYDLYTDDSDPKFSISEQKACSSRYIKKFWDNLTPVSQHLEKFRLPKTFLLLLFQFIYSINCTLHIQLARYKSTILWKNILSLHQKIFLIDLWSFHRNVLFPLTRHILIMIAFQPQLLNRIHFCQKSSDTHWMIKLWKWLTLLLHNTIQLLNFCFRRPNQLFFWKEQYRHNASTNSHSASYTQINFSAKIHEKYSEIENGKDQSTCFQKLFGLIKQIDDLIEQYPTSICGNCELFEIEFPKKNLHGYDAAYFSSASLQLSLKTMEHFSGDLQSTATLLKQNFTLWNPFKYLTLRLFPYDTFLCK